MMSLKFLFVFGVLAVSLGNVRAINAEDKKKFHAAVAPHIMECSAEFGVTEDDIKAAKESGELGNLNPCIIGCVFKKAKLIDDKGLFDADKAKEHIKLYLSEEADRKKAEEIISNCESVNEQEVGDGEKGCERAGLLFQCFAPFNESAANLDDMQRKYLEIIMDCSKDFPLTSEDIEQLKNKQFPDNEVVKCLFACAYKKTGMMDDRGKLSVDGVNNLAQKYFKDDPEKLKKAQEFTDACASVNDEAVGDGDKGCDRSALIFKCTVEKAPQFDFI